MEQESLEEKNEITLNCENLLLCLRSLTVHARRVSPLPVKYGARNREFHRAEIEMEVLMHEASSVLEIKTSHLSPRIVKSEDTKEKLQANDRVNGTHLAKFNNEQLSDIMFENIHYTVSLGWRKGFFSKLKYF